MQEPKGLVDRIRALGFHEPPEAQLRVNPFTGRSHNLPPPAVLLYDFITTKTLVCGKDYTRRDWDNARYWFCTNWPDQYYDLLD